MKPERKREIIASLKMCVDLEKDNLENYFETLHQLGIGIAKNTLIIELSNFFNILGNDVRLSILKLLGQKDYCVCELEAILDKSQSSISHHLRLLENAGLIRGIKRGYFTHYEIIKDNFKKVFNLFEHQFPNFLI